MGTFKEGGFAGSSPPAAGRRPRSLKTGGAGHLERLPVDPGWGELPSRPHPAGRVGGGVPRLWPARFPVAAAASLRLLGGRRAAPVFSFRAGMSAACARLPEEGRKQAGAPRPLAWGLAAPWRGLGSSRQGWARVEPPAPKGTPGSRAAAEGNRGRAGRGRPGGRPRVVPRGRPCFFRARLWARRGGVGVASRPRAAPWRCEAALCVSRGCV